MFERSNAIQLLLEAFNLTSVQKRESSFAFSYNFISPAAWRAQKFELNFPFYLVKAPNAKYGEIRSLISGIKAENYVLIVETDAPIYIIFKRAKKGEAPLIVSIRNDEDFDKVTQTVRKLKFTENVLSAHSSISDAFDPLRAFKGKIVFEVSIKGGNREEFGITTKCREDIYELPFRAVDNLQRINARLGNVDFVAIAGFGPTIRFMQGNEVASRATLYHPEGNRPFFHPDLWDEKFRELFSFITSKYPQFGGKMPMAGMEDRPNWKWGLPAIKRAKIEAAKYFYDSYADPRNEMLEERMRDLRAKFFITEPREYYPSLFTK